jgi:hypothetical protein
MDIPLDTPSCPQHHWWTVEIPMQDGTVKYGCTCSVCDLTVPGVYVGTVPDCALHWHKPKGR